MSINYGVILSPVITEKATRMTESNQVVFRVTLDATKPAIAKAVSDLFKVKVKALTEGKTSKGGRNNTGRIVVRYQGGGHKQRYRLIDFKRNKFNEPATVERLEYDPNRTAFILS